MAYLNGRAMAEGITIDEDIDAIAILFKGYVTVGAESFTLIKTENEVFTLDLLNDGRINLKATLSTGQLDVYSDPVPYGSYHIEIYVNYWAFWDEVDMSYTSHQVDEEEDPLIPLEQYHVNIGIRNAGVAAGGINLNNSTWIINPDRKAVVKSSIVYFDTLEGDDRNELRG